MEMKYNLLNTVRGPPKNCALSNSSSSEKCDLAWQTLYGWRCESFIQFLPRFVKNILVRCHHQWQYISAHQNRGVRLRFCQQESLWVLKSESGSSCFLWSVVSLGLCQIIKTGNFQMTFQWSDLSSILIISSYLCLFPMIQIYWKEICAEHEGFFSKKCFVLFLYFCLFFKERICGTKTLFVRSVKTRNTPAGNTNRSVYGKELWDTYLYFQWSKYLKKYTACVYSSVPAGNSSCKQVTGNNWGISKK